MADWRGTYQDDLGMAHKAVRLNTQWGAIDDRPLPLLNELDFLPPEFLEAATQGRGACSLPLTPRRCRCYIAADRAIWLDIPIPWAGGLKPYRDFLESIATNPEIAGFSVLSEQIPWVPTLWRI